ncbi:MAG: tRNA-modifying protein YgfZ [Alteromonadaceae bacterium]|nr:tRNA-modifying protein YgfZ [Alteromonadaceae bacterium]MBB20027.1 tRNA-modifying protein YgfZ [Rickettsiales bacterium]
MINTIDTADTIPANFICRLDDLHVLNISGEERIKYLQGQVTADMTKLSAHEALFGSHCDFKGKTWNIFYALEHNESVLFVSHKESAAASLPELKKYGVFAKVDFVDEPTQWSCFGGQGQQLEAVISKLFGDIPAEHLQSLSNANGVVFALGSENKRFMLVLTPEGKAQLALHETLTYADKTLWEVLDIKTGIAELRAATSNEFVPQMMNLQALDGISFNKGCYMGQEVVARTKFLGKNKRAAFILKADESVNLLPGDNLEIPVGENWRKGGTVLRSATLGKETWLLAVVANDTEVNSVMRLKDQPNAVFTVQSLPYSLE